MSYLKITATCLLLGSCSVNAWFVGTFERELKVMAAHEVIQKATEIGVKNGMKPNVQVVQVPVVAEPTPEESQWRVAMTQYQMLNPLGQQTFNKAANGK